MANIRYVILSAFFELLLILLVTECISMAAMEGPHCVWYGECSYQFTSKYCAYNGKAKPIEADAKRLLKKYCPDIAKEEFSCCNHEQLKNLENTFSNAKYILTYNSSSPVCFENFMKHVCGVVCSPKQSEFIHPARVESYNATYDTILTVDYYLSEEYMTATYNSCLELRIRDVITSKIITAMDVLCGGWGMEDCTPKRLFDSVGNEDTRLKFPFKTNYKTRSTNGYTLYNPLETISAKYNEDDLTTKESGSLDTKISTESVDDDHCISYGECHYFHMNRTCAYIGKAKPIEPDSKELLEEFCPDIAKEGLTCCNTEQLKNFVRSMLFTKHILTINNSSPVCWNNLMKHFCGLVCSPKQSKFLHPAHVESYNATHNIILAVDYYLSEEYMTFAYNACAQLTFQNAITSKPFPSMDFLCSEWHSHDCTPNRWFTSLGYGEGLPRFSFKINYITRSANGYTTYNPLLGLDNTTNNKNGDGTTNGKPLLVLGCKSFDSWLSCLINVLYFSAVSVSTVLNSF